MPLNETDCAVTYKVLVLGDHSVGKTALLNSLTGKSFQETMIPTVGVDFVRKIFEVDGALIQLLIWDSAGQERFRSMTKLQYRGVQGIVLVYDITNELTFNTLKYWIRSIQTEMERPKDNYEPTPVLICGSKLDLCQNRQISKVKGEKLANKEMAFGFFETSAKTGENVHALFHSLAFHITDIHNPKLMKSYHPYLIRPISTCDQSNSNPHHIKLREFKRKQKFKDRISKVKSGGGKVTIEPNSMTARYCVYDSDTGSSVSIKTMTKDKKDSKQKGKGQNLKNVNGNSSKVKKKHRSVKKWFACCFGKVKSTRGD